jgi:hypothetical protein
VEHLEGIKIKFKFKLPKLASVENLMVPHFTGKLLALPAKNITTLAKTCQIQTIYLSVPAIGDEDKKVFWHCLQATVNAAASTTTAATTTTDAPRDSGLFNPWERHQGVRQRQETSSHRFQGQTLQNFYGRNLWIFTISLSWSNICGQNKEPLGPYSQWQISVELVARLLVENHLGDRHLVDCLKSHIGAAQCLSTKWQGRSCVDQTSVNQMTIDQKSIDQTSVNEMSVNQMSDDQMSVDQMSVDQMSVDQMSVDQMSVDQM